MNDRGMTMVEVLVGFVILTIIMAGVYHMIQFGSNMLYESTDMRKGQTQFEEALYKSTVDESLVEKKDLGNAGSDFKLRPVGKFKDAQSNIELFKSDSVVFTAPSLCSYTYSGDFSEKFGLKVYGFE
jgi:prepilin-type N-terminal cleavage/methylation domain-containing protein